MLRNTPAAQGWDGARGVWYLPIYKTIIKNRLVWVCEYLEMWSGSRIYTTATIYYCNNNVRKRQLSTYLPTYIHTYIHTYIATPKRQKKRHRILVHLKQVLRAGGGTQVKGDWLFLHTPILLHIPSTPHRTSERRFLFIIIIIITITIIPIPCESLHMAYVLEGQKEHEYDDINIWRLWSQRYSIYHLCTILMQSGTHCIFFFFFFSFFSTKMHVMYQSFAFCWT